MTALRGSPTRTGAAWLIALAVLAFVLRWGGPSNLLDNDQERPASYILDVLRHGHWIVQTDWTGDITSKPPAYTWLAALASLPTGKLTHFTLYLPCGLAILATGLIVYGVASRYWGERAGFLAGLFFVANPLSGKLAALARTDGLFTFSVALTALLAFLAWTRDQPRLALLAWLAATFATLTKGPLGVLLGFMGLTAWIWERRRGAPPLRIVPHLFGVALVLVVAGGWFLLACQIGGDAVVQKMVRAELVQHVVSEKHGRTFGIGLIVAPAYFLSRFVPWSLLTLAGLVGVFRRPSPDPEARRLERFAAAWFLGGLLVFGLARHQRGDLIAPLMPAGALLAALPVAHRLASWSLPRFCAVTGGIGAAVLIGGQVQHLSHDRRIIDETRGVATLARRFVEQGGRPGTLQHLDAPFALQFFLNTMHRTRSPEELVAAVSDTTPVQVALVDPAPLTELARSHGLEVHPIVAWPEDGPARVQIVELRR